MVLANFTFFLFLFLPIRYVPRKNVATESKGGGCCTALIDLIDRTNNKFALNYRAKRARERGGGDRDSEME